MQLSNRKTFCTVDLGGKYNLEERGHEVSAKSHPMVMIHVQYTNHHMTGVTQSLRF